MRITNTMLVNNMINYIGNNLTRMDKFQNQLATGKKISVPSDDPVVAARALKLRTDVSEIDQYQRNLKDAQSWLDITEGTLSKMGDIMQRVRELTVEGANGTNTQQDTQRIAAEISQLKTQLIHMGNTTYAGRYIFSGYKTDKKLLIDDPADPNFGKFNISVSNSESIKYEIGIGDDIAINVPGGDLFNNGGAAVANTNGVTTGNANITSLTITAGVNDNLILNVDGAGLTPVNIPSAVYASNNALAAAIQTAVNTAVAPQSVTVSVIDSKLQFTSGSQGAASSVFIDGTSNAAANLGLATTTQVNGSASQTGSLITTITNLITDLNNGNTTNVGNALTTIDSEINNLLRVQSDVGARTNRIELTSNRLDSDALSFTKLMSENEDVDMAETIMNLKNEENVYRSSLSGGARVIQPSLMDFLR